MKKSICCVSVAFILSLFAMAAAHASPDLIVESVDAPSTAAIGGTISVSVVFENQGTDLTQGSYVTCRLIVSQDTAVNLGDVYYTEKTIPNSNLRAGWSTATTFTYTLPPSLQGPYYVGAYIDSATYHTESNENNNANYDTTPLVIGSTPPSAPTLYSPGNYSIRLNSTPHSFDWNSVPGANRYRTYVDNHSGFGSPEINQETTSSSLSSYTSLPNNIYYWKVQARNSSGQWGEWSTTRRFVVDTAPPAPSLSSPSNGSQYNQGTTIAFSWSGPNGYSINRHYLRIVKGTDLNAAPLYENEINQTSDSVLTTDWSPGTYTWGVRAIKNHPDGFNQNVYETTIGWGQYATRTFTIAEQPFDLTATLSTINAIPSNAQQGTEITIRCTVNKSGGSLPDPGLFVRVYLYLSQDKTSLKGAREICGDACAFDFNKTLLADGSESLQKTVTLPNDLQGPYYVFAVVDGPKYWTEKNESNNLVASPVTMAIWQGKVPVTVSDNGILARTWDNPDVFLISKYGKKWLLTGIAAVPGDPIQQLGYTDADVGWYGSGVLGNLSSSESIVSTSGSFCYRSQSSSSVYRVVNGESHPFLNWDTLLAQGFTEENIYWATQSGFEWIQAVYPVTNAPMIRVTPQSINFQ